MTNPFMPAQPQQPAANPFAPAPQQAPPAQYTQQPQQYAPQTQPVYAPAPQQAPQTATVPQFAGFMKPSAPPPPGAGNMPKVSDLQGRLLLIMPERLERGLVSKFVDKAGNVQSQDKLTATVVVLDGGLLQWGGTTPGSERKQENPPYVIKGLWIQQKNLIVQLTDALNVREQGGPGIALGRLWKTGPAQNDPYVLAEPNAQDEALAGQYVATVNPFTL